MGVEIRCNAEVAKIKVSNGTATGVVLAGGEEFDATKVASGVDPRWTFERFLDAKELPPDFLAAIKRIGYESASMKINVALAAPPNFTALPSSGVGPQHHGTMHFCPDQDFIERGYDDAKYGIPSRDPIVELCLPSALDKTVAPEGKHLGSMFVQYAPYKLKEGTWDDARKNAFADRCFDIIEQYAPGFKASVIDRQIVSPLDLEKTFGLTGGSIFQGAMHLNQLFLFRPVVGFANYRTPIKNLYLCGSAAHPGGGVMGIAGANAAREMLKWL
jgi:phytoene dehydrogenase-like protein